MELRHLHSFLALAEELHFGRAAERLGIAQPPLSRQIQQLEAEIGTTLFERSPRAVRLTRAGEELRHRVRSHVEGIASAVAATRATGNGHTGRLRVGFVSNLSYVLLPLVLEQLREAAPAAAFDLRELATDAQVDALRSGELDLALLVLPIADQGLIQRRLFQDPLIVVMPTDHPLASVGELSIKQLDQYPFVMCPRYRKTGFQHSILERCLAAGFEPRIAQEVEGKTLLYELISRGIGLSIVPQSSAHAPREGVVYRTLRETLKPVEVAAVWRKENEEPLRRLFVDTAVRCARESIVSQRARAVA